MPLGPGWTNSDAIRGTSHILTWTSRRCRAAASVLIGSSKCPLAVSPILATSVCPQRRAKDLAIANCDVADRPSRHVHFEDRRSDEVRREAISGSLANEPSDLLLLDFNGANDRLSLSRDEKHSQLAVCHSQIERERQSASRSSLCENVEVA